jgi:glutamyl-tRNA(Gln) amidotransferase subunit E
MSNKFNPKKNYEQTRSAAGYVNRKDAKQADYDRIGFMSGLEVHQQLLTKQKLFCHCPAGKLYNGDKFDAEVIRHMRPTLSELGEYDGTALMEFKTRKNITYKLKNETTCTYEVDDTPPFPIDREALEIALEISILSKLNIVGEVHITRKQYLDGSIPAGFQRTAILGVEGELQLKHKKVKLIQLSIEEDSCRELSDIGHERVYNTDRLGMPLIETVTYPELFNPDELRECCDYIRFLNRSTGKVRTGMGAGRQDVNVSCKGGSRVEIKGVAHTKWIPDLSHNEAFRQWSLLLMRDRLLKTIENIEDWKINSEHLNFYEYGFAWEPMIQAQKNNYQFVAVNLPKFEGALSSFTQPGQMFADELATRLKVIACIEKPNMIHSEEIEQKISEKDWKKIKELLNAKDGDSQIIIFGPADDIETALETIEERCQMALDGIPEETRKSFPDGSTIFERVLPGADRMYPDTDSAPIPLENDYIQELGTRIPDDIIGRFEQLRTWNIPEDSYTYIFSKNLYPEIKSIIESLDIKPSFIGTFIGHYFKNVEGRFQCPEQFNYQRLIDLFTYLTDEKLDIALARPMLPVLYEHPNLDFESILTLIKFKKISEEEICTKVKFLVKKWNEIGRSTQKNDQINWIMGQVRHSAIGNMSLRKLYEQVNESITKNEKN